MEEEIKQLKEKIEKLNELSSLHYKIVENEFKILRYEIQNNIIKTVVTPSCSYESMLTTITCRICKEEKKVMNGGNNHENKICHECGINLIKEYESDDDIN